MIRSRSFLLLSILTAFLSVYSTRAEMAPEVYERFKKESAEAVTIEAVTVTTTGSTITVEANILSVERSKSGLKPGDAIRISYQVIRHTEPIIGASQPIVLDKGKRYLAYLEQIEPSGTFRITAGGHSFLKVPVSGSAE